ncbi:hypothetical protein RJZ56_004077 [Blastomyces dermatitidis]|uniref:Myb-like domain-containing protein n=1 Tax=Ajellomyces dermatitidis (strain ER-3 / ATCC MYA-2586) TaxID=559297 RepID=A0ABP2EQ86_AJEDR|nr:uncharacterized protein BDCG_09030 [Blastomyces dermatitidis ER-3]EEQ85761.1 hypothetical protein BDCG_09030 [Blastomyces dermatitidis ER-3]EQL34107.1 hypothetical protein BDFG_04022 [Blastomyces dermatitidis ATCC 26199]
MKRDLTAAAFSEPEEETLARLGYHVDFDDQVLPGWAFSAPVAGLERDNPFPDDLLPNIDPRLHASVGNSQLEQESLFIEDNDSRNGNDNDNDNNNGDHHDDATTHWVDPDNGFYRDRFPEETLFVHSVEQVPEEALAGYHDMPEPQRQVQHNQYAAIPTANPQQSKRAKKPRKPKDKPEKTGRHSAAEISAVEDFKSQFCQSNNMSGEDFGRMVQHCETDRASFPCPESIMTRTEFWNHLYALMPGRKHKDVHRYMRSHYVVTSQKPRQWTREQDDELAALHAEHGSDFAKIARILGRARDDVNTRFRKHVQHRDNQNHGLWTDEECVNLENAVRQWRKAQPTEDDDTTAGGSLPGDIYQIDPHDILWTRVSELMGHTRTREQCGAKWRAMRRKWRERGHDTSPK